MKPTAKPLTQELKLARALYDKQQYAAALEKYEYLLHHFPETAEAHYYSGISAFALSNHMKALGHFLKASELEPENAEYPAWMGKCLHFSGHVNLAIAQYKKALELDESNLTALSDLGYIYSIKSLDNEATKLLQKAVAIKPSIPRNLANLSLVLARNGKYEESINYAKKSIKQEPKNAELYFGLGNVYLIHGNESEAIKCFHKSLDINPLDGNTFYTLAVSKKITPTDKDLIRKMEAAENKSMPSSKRKYLLYALGKAYDDLKDTEKAFAYIQKANMFVHSDYSPKTHTKRIKKTKQFYSKAYFNEYSHPRQDQRTPIFVIGMPRSGSTLIDQILSTHTKVHSVGESTAIIDILDEIRSKKGGELAFPDYLKDINKADIEHFREQYIAETSSGAGDATHIVDKNLFNYLCLGFISTLFPNAKIIHTMRHPLDTCFSCYMTGFTFSESTWTHDLEFIGKYYRDYAGLMDHWHKVLPSPILDVQYEEMVTDTEGTTRRVLEFCELEWEDPCLDFYKTKRGVSTASVWQVRQPIYKTAVQRWVPYAKHLQPLILALGDLLEDDYAQLESLGLKHGARRNSLSGKLSRLLS